jgi:hypothetical protein
MEYSKDMESTLLKGGITRADGPKDVIMVKAAFPLQMDHRTAVVLRMELPMEKVKRFHLMDLCDKGFGRMAGQRNSIDNSS